MQPYFFVQSILGYWYVRDFIGYNKDATDTGGKALGCQLVKVKFSMQK